MKFRIDRHARDLDLFRRNAVVDQLPPGVLIGDKIKRNVIARPTLPKAVTRIGYNSYKWHLIRKIKLFQNPCEKMLGERMNTDDDVRAPFFELAAQVANRAFEDKLARFGADLIHGPIEIFHPMLLVLQHPVVKVNEFFRDPMRFLNRPDSAYSRRLALPKLLQPVRDRFRRGTMPAAGVGGDYEDFWSVLRHRLDFDFVRKFRKKN